MKERESNYDWLRALSMFAVILMHVSVYWVDGFYYAVLQGTDIEEYAHPFAAYVYYSLSAFAVPCFLMVSGAFILDNTYMNFGGTVKEALRIINEKVN